MRTWLVVLCLAGCAATVAPPPPPPPPPPPRRVEPPPEPVVKPPGYVEVRPLDALDTESGDMYALLLLDELSNKVLPIYIGGTEGAAIQARLRGARPVRPLTHDLLDEAVKQLRGAIVKVQIDALIKNTFHGSVYIRSGRRLIRLDARSSDAVALGIGNRVPIYCAQVVIDQAGVSRDQATDGDP